MRLTSRILRRSLRPTNGCSFSAIFLGRVARLVVLGPAWEVDDLADRDEAADAAVDDQPTLGGRSPAASMIAPDSNCSCIARHLRSRPARRSDRTTWPPATRAGGRRRGRCRRPPVGRASASGRRARGSRPRLRSSRRCRRGSRPCRSGPTVPSTTSPCLKLLMSESCSGRAAPPSSSARDRVAGDERFGLLVLGRGRGIGELGGQLGWHPVPDRGHSSRRRRAEAQVPARESLRRPPRARIGSCLGGSPAQAQRPLGGLGGTSGRLWGGGCAGRGLAGGGGLVGDGDRRDALLGRLVIDRSDCLDIRRRPSCCCSVDLVVLLGDSPGNRDGPSAARAGADDLASPVQWGPSSLLVMIAAATIFCVLPLGAGESSTRFSRPTMALCPSCPS